MLEKMYGDWKCMKGMGDFVEVGFVFKVDGFVVFYLIGELFWEFRDWEFLGCWELVSEECDEDGVGKVIICVVWNY